MRYLLIGLVGYLLMLLEGSVLHVLRLDVVAPDAALVLVVAVAMSRRGTLLAHGLFALAMGWLADVLGSTPRGVYATTYVVAALCARRFARRVYVEGTLSDALTGVVAGAGAAMLSALLAPLAAGARATVPAIAEPSTAADLWTLVPAQAVGTALVAPPLFALCRSLDRRLGLEHRPLRVP